MQCVRCGAIFEGRFCPRCGAPAMAAPAAQGEPMGWPCPRCGTLFRGNFCPRCGLPTAAWAYRPPATPSGGRTVLSILWTLALVGFIIFVITDFAALVAAPAYVVPGIQTIGSGQTVNSGFDFDAGNWTFDPLGTGSAGIYRSAAGHPDGFLDMSLPSSGARGYWWQAFRVDGSVPFTGAVHLDLQISGGLTSGRLIVAVDSANSPPDPRIAIGLVNFTGPTSCTAMPRFLAADRLTDPGIYYLKIAFFADSATTPVSVGLAVRARERGGLRGVRVPHLVDRPPDGPRIRRASDHRCEPRWDRERTGGGRAAHRRRLAVPDWRGRPPRFVEGNARGGVGLPDRELGDLRTRARAGLGIVEGHPGDGRRPRIRLFVPTARNRGRDLGAFRERLCGRAELFRLRGRGVPPVPEPVVPRARNRRSGILRLVPDRGVETLPRPHRAIPTADPRRGHAGIAGAVLFRRPAARRDPPGSRTTAAFRPTVVRDAVRRAARRRRPQRKSHPQGVYAFVRPPSVRVSAGPIPMPVLRVGRSQVRRGPFHVHAVRPHRLGLRGDRALGDVVDCRLQVVGLDLDRDVPEGRRGREVHDADERRLLAQAHVGAIPSTTGEQLTSRGVPNPLVANQLPKPVEILRRPDDSAFRRFDARVREQVSQRGHHPVRNFRRMKRRLDANVMHRPRFAPSPLIFSGCLVDATKVF